MLSKTTGTHANQNLKKKKTVETILFELRRYLSIEILFYSLDKSMKYQEKKYILNEKWHKTYNNLSLVDSKFKQSCLMSLRIMVYVNCHVNFVKMIKFSSKFLIFFRLKSLQV